MKIWFVLKEMFALTYFTIIIIITIIITANTTTVVIIKLSSWT